MNRPQYETQAHQNEETRLTEFILSQSGKYSSAVKLNNGYILDYAMINNNQILAFAEMKCRSFPANKYPTTIVGMHKILSARQYKQSLSLPTFLFIGWTDYAGWCELSDVDFSMHIAGRTDRNDKQDMSPHAFIDINNINMIGEWS